MHYLGNIRSELLRKPKSYKEVKDLATRKAECEGIAKQFPGKVALILERYNNETELPPLDKSKLLVSGETLVGSLLMFIRKRIKISETQSIYLVAGNEMLTGSKSIAEVYQDYKDEDGFLYLTYASQNVFGSM